MRGAHLAPRIFIGRYNHEKGIQPREGVTSEAAPIGTSLHKILKVPLRGPGANQKHSRTD